MSLKKGEVQFALELIIANKNETGSTLSDIQDDYQQAFGQTFESMFGQFWADYLRDLLTNTMEIFTEEHPGLHSETLFFIRVEELQQKLLAAKNDANMMAILNKLNINPETIKPHRVPDEKVQSSFNSTGLRSVSSSGTYFKSTDFYKHTLIADNFFLELSHIDLRMPKTKKNFIERIGLCVSGQTIGAAYRAISNSRYPFYTDGVILNIGTFDLLNGQSAEDMIRDLLRLLNALKAKNLQPVMTTLAPLPNHKHNIIEERRQAFNKFIRDNFEFIDVEKCFLSNEKRILLECYQKDPKPVGGNTNKVLLWNRVGRQRVLQAMKREIPNTFPLF